MGSPLDVLPSEPVIIIGAARSGTNMLRDMLVKLPGVSTWPCDEINYIWRHGNARFPHDELPPELATPGVCKYIRNAFRSQTRRNPCRILVEKTCANSLRVDFVDRVVPEARYLFIVRDGRDVVASAMQRWTAPFELMYTLRKARFVPVEDLGYYVMRYAAHRAFRLFSPEKRLKSWGPRWEGMQALLATASLDEICATQWARSVATSERQLEKRAERVLKLRYEAVARQPGEELTRIAEFLSIEADPATLKRATQGISARSVGNWKKSLSCETQERVMPLLQPQLEAMGYGKECE